MQRDHIKPTVNNEKARTLTTFSDVLKDGEPKQTVKTIQKPTHFSPYAEFSCLCTYGSPDCIDCQWCPKRDVRWGTGKGRY